MTYPAPYGPPAGQPASSPKQPWYKKTWVLLVATGLVALMIGTAAGQSQQKKQAAAAGPTTTLTATTTVTAPAPAAATVTARPTVIKTVATRVRTERVTYTPPPPKSFGEGTYVVGEDIQPGRYKMDGNQGYCAYFLASDKGGSNLTDSNNTSNGPLSMVVTPGTGSVVIQGTDCTFHRVAS